MPQSIFFTRLNLVALAAASLLSSCQTPPMSKSTTTIGVIVPMDHMALREIVGGLEATLLREKGSTIQVKIKNAQGDTQMQRMIIQQMIQEDVDILAPIGLAASQMTSQMTSEIPIVCLGADLSLEQVASNVTGVNDEISSLQQLQLMKEMLPHLHKITLIHSPAEKVFQEVEQLKQLCQADHIHLQDLMIQSLSDLYPTAQAIDRDSDLIFVLKDHLVVSGINTLAQVAAKLKIPLMASDEGSVREGAALALGVRESETGEQGGRLILQILDSRVDDSRVIDLKTLPKPQVVKTLQLFINSESCQEEDFDKEIVLAAAKRLFIALPPQEI